MNEKFRKTSRKNTENEMLFRRSKKEKILFGIAFAIMAVYAFTLLYSLFFLFINSLESSFAYTDKLTAAKNSFAFPEKLHWENYKKAFENLGFSEICFSTARGIFSFAWEAICSDARRWHTRFRNIDSSSIPQFTRLLSFR